MSEMQRLGAQGAAQRARTVAEPSPLASSAPDAGISDALISELSAAGYACRPVHPSDFQHVPFSEYGLSPRPEAALQLSKMEGDGASFTPVGVLFCGKDNCLVVYQDRAALDALQPDLLMALRNLKLENANLRHFQTDSWAGWLRSRDSFQKGSEGMQRAARLFESARAFELKYGAGTLLATTSGVGISMALGEPPLAGGLGGFLVGVLGFQLTGLLGLRLRAKADGKSLEEVLKKKPWKPELRDEKTSREFIEKMVDPNPANDRVRIDQDEWFGAPEILSVYLIKNLDREKLHAFADWVPNNDILAGIALALGEIGDEESSHRLRQIYDRPLKPRAQRRELRIMKMAVLDGLAALEGPAAMGFLFSKAVVEPDLKVREHAVAVLAKLPLPDDEERTRLSQSADPQSRFKLSLYWATRLDTRAVPGLLAALEQGEPIAADALRAFGSPGELRRQLRLSQAFSPDQLQALLRRLERPEYTRLFASR